MHLSRDRAGDEQRRAGAWSPGLVTALYVLGGIAWIAGTDLVLHRFIEDPDAITVVQLVKGWGYVGVTALVLFLLLRRHHRVEAGRESLDHESRTIFGVGGEANLLVDDRLRVRRANQGMARLLGYRPEEIEGRALTEIAGPRDRFRLEEHHRMLVEGGSEATEVFECGLIDREGRERSLMCSTARLASSRLVLVSLFDLTDRMALEAQLAHAQKLEAVGKLAAGVAHDFNNIVTAIRGYAQLLRDDLAGEDDACADLDEILAASDRATTLTRRLLAFSRPAPSETTELSVHELLGGIERMLSRLLREDIDLALRLDAAEDVIRGVGSRLEQVLVNLAVNANDAMPQGGRLRIETANVSSDGSDQIAVQAGELPPGEYLQILVEDTGVGIAPENLGKIFDPFFTTKEAEEGTGLGLSTTLGIIHQHRGHLHVDSVVGHGTAFTIFLPLASWDMAQPEEAGDPRAFYVDPGARGSERVLVVEDDEALRHLMLRMLRHYGYELFEASTASEALDWLETADRPPELVICDVNLPDRSGPSVMADVTRRQPGMPVLFISGHRAAVNELGDELDRDEVLFLAKPFNGPQLAAALRRLLTGRWGRAVDGVGPPGE